MTAPVVNTELLLKIYDTVESDPQAWDQTCWANRTECGTTYCIAGWACVLSDVNLRFTPHGKSVVARSGRQISDVARELLGLDGHQAYELFYDTETNPAEFAEKIRRFTGIDVNDRVVSVTP